MDQFLGEIRPVPYSFAPANWAFCDGQIMSIQQNTALFSLLGTQFGGNGTTTFALPDLRGRIPLGAGQAPNQTYEVGEAAGSETVAITDTTNPSHVHGLIVSNSTANIATPVGSLAAISDHNVYTDTATGTFAASAVSSVGSGTPHDNHQPYTVISYIIALTGVFPQRS